MHPVPGSKSALGDSRGNLPHPHSVKSFEQVQCVELVLLILQSNQKWVTIKFEVNFFDLLFNLIQEVC